jgi:hypothetical protein
MRQTLVALIALVLSFTADLLAQEPQESVLGTLKPGQIVRVRPRTGDRIESRVLSMQGDSLVLSLGGSSVMLSARTMDSLWIKGRATGLGAIIGAAIAAVGSVVISAAVCESIQEDFPCGESGKAIAASIAGGAVLGGAIGSVVPKWRLRYARNLVVDARLTVRPQLSVALSITIP